MQITVRVNGSLASALGTSRLNATLPDEATIETLLVQLQQAYPDSAEILRISVPIIAGQHQLNETVLHNGQEVALLVPIAGG